MKLLGCAVFDAVLQEVATAAENIRIFSPLGGPLPAPQGESPSEEWALDVAAKGNAAVFALFSVRADGFAGFREFRVGDSSTGRQ